MSAKFVGAKNASMKTVKIYGIYERTGTLP